MMCSAWSASDRESVLCVKDCLRLTSSSVEEIECSTGVVFYAFCSYHVDCHGHTSGFASITASAILLSVETWRLTIPQHPEVVPSEPFQEPVQHQLRSLTGERSSGDFLNAIEDDLELPQVSILLLPRSGIIRGGFVSYALLDDGRSVGLAFHSLVSRSAKDH